jgi:hypothetical protein
MHDLDDIGAIAAYIACDSVTRTQRFASSLHCSAVLAPLALCAAGGEAGSPRRARPMRDTGDDGSCLVVCAQPEYTFPRFRHWSLT